MWFTPARYLTIAILVLGSGQAAYAQGTSSAKLGAPPISGASRPQADPGTLFAFADSVGKTLQFAVIGSATGTIWGDGVYTSDSVLATAAVHAGLLQPGESGVVSVEVLEGQSSYDGVERNGVVSRSYADWDVAYRFVGVSQPDDGLVLPDPGDLSAYRGQDGSVLTFEVTGDAAGAVWGDGIYTDDSRLAAVAVHAGILQSGQTGLVRVEILRGQDSYDGAERHGVASGTYATWPGSYRVLPISLKSNSKLSNLGQ